MTFFFFFFWAELGEAGLYGGGKEMRLYTWGDVCFICFMFWGGSFAYGKNWLDAVLGKRKIFDQAANSAF